MLPADRARVEAAQAGEDEQELQVAADGVGEGFDPGAPGGQVLPGDRLAAAADAVEGDGDDRVGVRQVLHAPAGGVVHGPELLHHAVGDVGSAPVGQRLVAQGALVARDRGQRARQPVGEVTGGLLAQRLDRTGRAALGAHGAQVHRDGLGQGDAERGTERVGHAAGTTAARRAGFLRVAENGSGSP